MLNGTILQAFNSVIIPSSWTVGSLILLMVVHGQHSILGVYIAQCTWVYVTSPMPLSEWTLPSLVDCLHNYLQTSIARAIPPQYNWCNMSLSDELMLVFARYTENKNVEHLLRLKITILRVMACSLDWTSWGIYRLDHLTAICMYYLAAICSLCVSISWFISSFFSRQHALTPVNCAVTPM